MRIVDLILLHPPSVYDFRDKTIAFGPVSDVVPSTGTFEMYPIGFVSILGYLRKHGFNVRIVNLATKMLKDPSFNVEGFIKKIDARAFGLDLHWLVHAHGCLEIAKIIRREHPNVPIIVGGLSASYFHRQLVEDFPQIDHVLRGDSVELPLLHLMQCIMKNKEPNEVPNLTWRSENGAKRVNPLSWVPNSLDDFVVDYGEVAKSVFKFLDITGHLPSKDWMEYPITAILTCKGCTKNCITCGGSFTAYKQTCNRSKPVFKSAEKIVEEIKTIEQHVEAPIFLIGDFKQGGRKYAEKVLNSIKEEDIDNPLIFELFAPVSMSYLKMIVEACEPHNLQISPESHDERVRRLHGRSYSNDALKRTIDNAIKLGFRKIDVFFMIGLAGQTMESVRDTVKYSEYLLTEFGADKKIHPFIAPLAPFLDPGSIAFENPEKFGYHRLFSSLSEHKEALAAPSWKYFLNYRTKWMGRDEIVSSTYEAAYCLNELKRKFALINEDDGENLGKRIILAHTITEKVDEILASAKNPKTQEEELKQLKADVADLGKGLMCSTSELMVPYEYRIKKFGQIKTLLRLR